MSSYICEPIHFNSVEKALKDLFKNQDFDSYQFEKYGLYKAQKTNKELDTTISKVVDKWREMNVLAVSYQYSHHYENLDEEIQIQLNILNQKDDKIELTTIGLFKALKCINYQIEFQHIENIRNDLRVYLEFLDLLMDAIANHIVENLSEYRNTQWSISSLS